MTIASGCALCGRPWGEVSKSFEHVLGHLRRRPGDLPNERTSISMAMLFDPEAQEFSEHPASAESRKSSLLNLRTRAVCKSCNEGWMSTLENQAKPVLRGLEDSAAARSHLEIPRADALTVARWAQKTALTHELTTRSPSVGDLWMGDLLRQGAAIRGSAVRAARNDADFGVQVREAHIEISDTFVVRPGDPYRLALITAITWHYLTLLVYISDTPGRIGPHLPLDRWSVVWPCAASGLDYPPMSTVTQEELNAVLSDHHSWLPVVRHSGVRRLIA